MKKLIKNSQEILGMARVGWVPVGNENGIEVYVNTNDGGNMPHFHVRKYGSNNSFEWETCIAFEDSKYFLHGHYKDKLPNSKIAKQLDNMLRSVRKKSRYEETYWEFAIDMWNANNSSVQLSYDLEQPDYRNL